MLVDFNHCVFNFAECRYKSCFFFLYQTSAPPKPDICAFLFMEPFHFNFSVFLLLVALLFFKFFLVKCNALGQCLQKESFALLQLKRGFTFGKLETWQPGTDCCKWDGVTCDELGRVTNLDLSNRSISGKINHSLFNLTSLRALNFANNWFENMPIPDFGWDKLTNLSSLNLSYSGFVGKVPASISRLRKLTSIDLSLNFGLFLTAKPTFLRNMSSLRELFVDLVDISAYRDEWCGALVNSTPVLEALHMQGCSLFGASCSSLSKLPFLSIIWFGDNTLDSSILDSFVNFTSLTELEVQENGFKGVFPNKIFLLRNLRHLDISNNPMLSGYLPKFLEDSNLEILALSSTNFSGNLPDTIGNLKFLIDLDLSSCQFSGTIPPSLGNLSLLSSLYLSNNNKLHGQVPRPIFQISGLILLSLASNNFSGVLELEFIKNLKKLLYLDLSNSGFSLSIWDADNGSLSSSFPNVMFLGLSGCNLTKIPAFIRHQHQMHSLDLSNNRIQGQIPSWLWSIVEQANFLNVDWFISLANNNLIGEISPLICNLSRLWLLDLSMNRLTGSIPPCLFEDKINLHVLNLRGNLLHGAIPYGMSSKCTLQNIILRDNQLEGSLPRSLPNCQSLEILDLGNNKLNDTFPYWLGNMSSLRVLVLRSNKFHGLVGPLYGNHQINYSFSMLHVLDISSNNFSGKLDGECFTNLKSIMVNISDATQNFAYNLMGEYYDLDVLTIMNKGQLMTLQKFWKIFMSIDFSNNYFEGEIPLAIGQLVSLQVLNLSYNRLAGKIPPQLGNLPQLESLDLSMNNISGKIPHELVSLHFLSYLNLSYNNLVGKIPLEGQFCTFSKTSFEGNEGLCWSPCNTLVPKIYL
ncbi:receptor-like protein 7 [Dendrobium catenatum]|uniref:receptor-like protein 7 n=1 Tax=Dendrobium catenatum TaxID=906689 RepID=UPI0010A04489|nr:receptor-like protein 7 [Dendrobium catenatum]